MKNKEPEGGFKLRVIGSSDFVSEIPFDFDRIVEGWDAEGALTFATEAEAEVARASDPDGDDLMVEQMLEKLAPWVDENYSRDEQRAVSRRVNFEVAERMRGKGGSLVASKIQTTERFFRCEMCLEDCVSDRPDEEARQEAVDNGFTAADGPMSIVCDECYQLLGLGGDSHE